MKYTWRNGWAMKYEEIEADSVEFHPEHVVFFDVNDRLILAKQNKYVDNLRPVND
jgi:hypothetical protein